MLLARSLHGGWPMHIIVIIRHDPPIHEQRKVCSSRSTRTELDLAHVTPHLSRIKVKNSMCVQGRESMAPQSRLSSRCRCTFEFGMRVSHSHSNQNNSCMVAVLALTRRAGIHGMRGLGLLGCELLLNTVDAIAYHVEATLEVDVVDELLRLSSTTSLLASISAIR